MGENSHTNSEQMETTSEPFEQSNFENFLQNAYKNLLEGTQSANKLPRKADYKYYATYPKFKEIVKDQSEQISNMISIMFQHKTNAFRNFENKDLGGQLQMLKDFNTKIFEGLESSLSDANMFINNIVSKDVEPMVSEVGQITIPENKAYKMKDFTFHSNIERPQMHFKDKIDNSVNMPWEPRIKEKPNSIKPLAIFLEETDDEHEKIFTHPYEMELEQYKPIKSQLLSAPPIEPKSLAETPLKYIENKEQLQELYKDLFNYTEIAIDLEHHSFRSFLGFTCLMQISTGDTDYLIDTIALRNDLWILNEIFTKPSVVKVLHGAVSDIQWLQRDLSLYIVNMFDTQIAAKTLEFSRLSLAALMQFYCQRTANKEYQLADWRLRPLTENMMLYAREDTHYLLYIYHKMKNELIQKSNGKTNLLESVLYKSRDLCKIRYVKPLFTEESYLTLYRSSRKNFDNRQKYALKELYRWRDFLAREEDESIGYVLPNNMLLKIAEQLPREAQGIFACCNPVPSLVRKHFIYLHQIILKARSQPLVQPILNEDPINRQINEFNGFSLNSVLYCPHDLSKNEDVRDDLATLLTNSAPLVIAKTSLLKSQPLIDLFHSEKTSNKIEGNVERNITFLCPFERYKLVKSYYQLQEKKAEEERQKSAPEVVETTDNTARITKLYENINKSLQWLQEQDNENKKKQESEQVEESVNVPKPAETVNVTSEDIISFKPKLPQKRKREASPKFSINVRSDEEIKKLQVTENENNQVEDQSQQRPKKNRFNRNKKGSKGNKFEAQPWKPFDYSTVDYQNFKGGSNSGQPRKDLRTNFKHQKKQGKKRDKTFDYSKNLGFKKKSK